MLPRMRRLDNRTLSCVTTCVFLIKGEKQVGGVVTRLRVEIYCEEEYACGGSVDILPSSYYYYFHSLRIVRTTKFLWPPAAPACGWGGRDKREHRNALLRLCSNLYDVGQNSEPK